MGSGHFPCFARYKHKEAPLEEIYADAAYIRKAKQFVSEIIECKSPLEIKQKISAHEIKPIRPDSREDKKVLALISDPSTTLLKIDYGNTPFRIYFGLSNIDGLAYVYLIDTKHRYY